MSNMYGYSEYEIMAMIIITAFTNFIMIFNLLYAIKQKIPHYIFIMSLIMFTSFMYHLSDSLGTGIVAQTDAWHILDNIASITGVTEVFNYFMQNTLTTRLQISWINLFLIIIVQSEYTYEIWGTLGPIFLSCLQLLFKKLFFSTNQKTKQINQKYLKRGLPLLAIGIISFIKGLNDMHDYLRAWHGLWHLSIATSMFYIFQIYEDEEIDFIDLIIYFKNQLKPTLPISQ